MSNSYNNYNDSTEQRFSCEQQNHGLCNSNQQQSDVRDVVRKSPLCRPRTQLILPSARCRFAPVQTIRAVATAEARNRSPNANESYCDGMQRLRLDIDCFLRVCTHLLRDNCLVKVGRWTARGLRERELRPQYFTLTTRHPTWC